MMVLWWWRCVQCVRGKNVAVCACDRGTYDCRRVGIASEANVEGRVVAAAARRPRDPAITTAPDGGRTRPAPNRPEQEAG